MQGESETDSEREGEERGRERQRQSVRSSRSALGDSSTPAGPKKKVARMEIRPDRFKAAAAKTLGKIHR